MKHLLKRKQGSPLQLTCRFNAYPHQANRESPVILAIYMRLPPMLVCTMGTVKTIPFQGMQCRTDP